MTTGQKGRHFQIYTDLISALAKRFELIAPELQRCPPADNSRRNC